mmetsp:Transcript_34465/g.71127  ORF Transcript_34465/g.71127 Transcript_34465/m.71127 type:complete len:297 (-) Transcript_34465:264-1154(-)
MGSPDIEPETSHTGTIQPRSPCACAAVHPSTKFSHKILSSNPNNSLSPRLPPPCTRISARCVSSCGRMAVAESWPGVAEIRNCLYRSGACLPKSRAPKRSRHLLAIRPKLTRSHSPRPTKCSGTIASLLSTLKTSRWYRILLSTRTLSARPASSSFSSFSSPSCSPAFPQRRAVMASTSLVALSCLRLGVGAHFPNSPCTAFPSLAIASSLLKPLAKMSAAAAWNLWAVVDADVFAQRWVCSDSFALSCSASASVLPFDAFSWSRCLMNAFHLSATSSEIHSVCENHFVLLKTVSP